ncbi:MAG TPA: hypothetical protein EYN69_12420 [Flavobacteriales bacterium]|nr:hypothetical protein [Flavobacteriales bacterium]
MKIIAGFMKSQFIHRINHQLLRNLPFVQKGMNNPAYKGLWCGRQERRIIHFHQVIDRLIMEDGGQVPDYK